MSFCASQKLSQNAMRIRSRNPSHALLIAGCDNQFIPSSGADIVVSRFALVIFVAWSGERSFQQVIEIHDSSETRLAGRHRTCRLRQIATLVNKQRSGVRRAPAGFCIG